MEAFGKALWDPLVAWMSLHLLRSRLTARCVGRGTVTPGDQNMFRRSWIMYPSPTYKAMTGVGNAPIDAKVRLRAFAGILHVSTHNLRIPVTCGALVRVWCAWIAAESSPTS